MNIDMDKVPLTYQEAFSMFLEALSDEEKTALKDVEEKQIAIFHPTWGEELRNYWSMWEKDTPLVLSFKKIGITHADDMTGILLTSAHRHLNGKDIKLKEQTTAYKEYWKKEIGKSMP